MQVLWIKGVAWTPKAGARAARARALLRDKLKEAGATVAEQKEEVERLRQQQKDAWNQGDGHPAGFLCLQAACMQWRHSL